MKKLTVALQGRDATKSQRFRPASGLSTVSTDMITPPFRRAHNGSKVTASGGTTTTSTRLFAKSRVVGLGKSGRKLLMGTTGDDREVVKGPRKRLNKKRKSNISKEPIRAQAASSLARFLNSGLVRNDQGVSEDVSSKSGSKGSAKDSGYSTQKSSSSLSHAADRLQNEGSLANKSGSIRSLFASSRRTPSNSNAQLLKTRQTLRSFHFQNLRQSKTRELPQTLWMRTSSPFYRGTRRRLVKHEALDARDQTA